MEGLAAFFLESTFLGLWIFGWDRLPKRVHLACIWLVALGSMLSADVHPGRQLVDAAPGRLHDRPATAQPELNNIGALFTNPTFLWGYVHVILAVAGHRVAGDARGVGVAPAQGQRDVEPFHRTAAALGRRAVARRSLLQMFGRQQARA